MVGERVEFGWLRSAGLRSRRVQVHSTGNECEFDHERHVFRSDERLFSAGSCLDVYGFIPETLAQDAARFPAGLIEWS